MYTKPCSSPQACQWRGARWRVCIRRDATHRFFVLALDEVELHERLQDLLALDDREPAVLDEVGDRAVRRVKSSTVSLPSLSHSPHVVSR